MNLLQIYRPKHGFGYSKEPLSHRDGSFEHQEYILRLMDKKKVKFLTTGPRLKKTFFILNSAENENYPAFHVKMPTIVDILTFISNINKKSGKLKARNVFICRYFSFWEQLKLYAQFS